MKIKKIFGLVFMTIIMCSMTACSFKPRTAATETAVQNTVQTLHSNQLTETVNLDKDNPIDSEDENISIESNITDIQESK